MKLIKSKGRKLPYTEKGITRMQCAITACNNQAYYQWKICSNNNLFTPICVDCDIMINKIFLKLIAGKNFDKLINKYIKFAKGE